MRYTTIDGWTVTGCPFKPDRFVGGFACFLCEHWQGGARRISGCGDSGESEWDVACRMETIGPRQSIYHEKDRYRHNSVVPPSYPSCSLCGHKMGTASRPIGGIEETTGQQICEQCRVQIHNDDKQIRINTKVDAIDGGTWKNGTE